MEDDKLSVIDFIEKACELLKKCKNFKSIRIKGETTSIVISPNEENVDNK